jgi:hypothetical protein
MIMIIHPLENIINHWISSKPSSTTHPGFITSSLAAKYMNFREKNVVIICMT